MLSTTTVVLAAAVNTNPLIPDVRELIWGAVSFAILFAIMSKYVFPKVAKTLEERTQNIEGKLETAEQQRAQAQVLVAQYEQKLQEANAESARILDQARQNAARLETELRAKAEEQAARIVERAQEQIQGERDRALTSLRTEVGGLAVDLATRIVGSSLDRERQLSLVDQYIKELPAVRSGSH